MLNRPAGWYRSVMVVGVVVALLMVVAMEGLQEMRLTLWLHIPLTAIVLTLMAGGAGVAGVAFLEWRERLAGKRVGSAG